GVSSAVTLGMVVAQACFGIGATSTPAAGIGLVSGLVVVCLLFLFSVSGFGQEVDRLVLFGMALNFLFSATLFLILSYVNQQVGGGSIRWLFWQIPWVNSGEVSKLVLLGCPFLIGMFALSRHLDALSLGDSVARTLGFHANRSRTLLLLLSSILLS